MGDSFSSDTRFLPHFDLLLQQFNSAPKVAHARVSDSDPSIPASQLDPIDTGFGTPLVRVKPLVETRRCCKIATAEKCPPNRPRLASCWGSKRSKGGRQTFGQVLSQVVAGSKQ